MHWTLMCIYLHIFTFQFHPSVMIAVEHAFFKLKMKNFVEFRLVVKKVAKY